MPASDFSWSPHRQPLCHGIKRKLSVFSQSSENEMEEEQVGGDAVSVKRRCITLSSDISHDMNNMFEINHNDEQAYDLNNFNDNNNSNTPNRNSFHVADQQTNSRQPSLVQALPGPSSNHLTNVFVQQSKLTCTVISHNHHHQQPSSQGDMIMDLNDETYSNTRIDLCSVEESSHSAMESDYVPNPEQYQLSRGSNSFRETGSPDNYSMTNSVKSYCRPYWDTQDLRPYISDYY
uniref:Uncharacterized protein n=1 Tax=Crassostrea virginica TaxID=6565 RepID=A0A8B8APJ9_CRAVI|nr:putative uncharacterized protein DDB_G0267716 isoform X1 [Crassostrea virginica]